MRRVPTGEMTWTKAVVLGLVITVVLLIFLVFIPSQFIYWYGGQESKVVALLDKTTGRKWDPYIAVRLRDMIVMGYSTTMFAIPVAATYFIMERRRRRLGLRGAEQPKEYLSGK